MSQVRETLASLEGRLDDVRREQAWRGIEHALDHATEPAPTRPFWRYRLAFATVVVAIAIAFIATRRSPTIETPATELAAEPGQRTVFERDGVTLTLFGPARATVAGHPDGTVHVAIASGTVVADRLDDAPGLTLTAGSNTTVTHDRKFAVRVEHGMVVLGAGEQAKEIVDRHVHELAPPAPPVTAPPVTAPPVELPAPVAPVEPPSPRPRVVVPPPEPPAEPPTEVEPTPLPAIVFSANELYRRAEAALAIKDAKGARDFLEQLLRDYPTDPRVDAARYDLALLARAANDLPRARALLDTILTSGTDAGVKAAAKRLRDQLKP